MTNKPIVIKGTREGITILVENDSFENLEKALYEKLKKSPDFFTGGKACLKVRKGSLNHEEYLRLKKLLTDFGMKLQEADSPKTYILPKPNRNRVLLLKKTVRSGQKITYGGTIVILGDVNPGSEVIAAGDILVMGKLRGIAHAGVKGDRSAIVAAFRLQPTQLRIADVFSRPPEGYIEKPQFPEIARLKDDIILIEPYDGLYRNKGGN